MDEYDDDDVNQSTLTPSPKVINCRAENPGLSVNLEVSVVQKVQVKHLSQIPVIPATLKNNPNFSWSSLVSSKVGSTIKSEPKQKSFESPSKLYEDEGLFFCQSIENLVKIMALKTDSLKVKQKENYFLGNSKQILLQGRFKCQECKDFFIQVSLKCGHSTCFSCFGRNIRNFIRSPSLQTAKVCICKKCFEFHSIEDVRIYLKGSENEIQQFQESKVMKTCLWCQRKLDVFTGFYPELECFHLCKNCYSHELFMEVKSCMVCCSDFKNKELSYQRETCCSRCKSKGEIIREGCWAFHDVHYLCYKCLEKSTNDIINHSLCPACNQNIDKKSVILFKSFINKACAACNKVHHISSLKICSECCNFSCESCLKNRSCIQCSY